MPELVLYGIRLLAPASLGKLSTNEIRASTFLDQWEWTRLTTTTNSANSKIKTSFSPAASPAPTEPRRRFSVTRISLSPSIFVCPEITTSLIFPSLARSTSSTSGLTLWTSWELMIRWLWRDKQKLNIHLQDALQPPCLHSRDEILNDVNFSFWKWS